LSRFAFWGDIIPGTNLLLSDRDTFTFINIHQPEVAQASGLSINGKQDVVWLDVAMNKSFGVSDFQGRS